MATESTTSFPVGSRVILKDLTKGTEFNGKVGIVKSKLTTNASADERQQVLLIQSGKTLGIKPKNLKYEPRSVKSLSVTELKSILVAKKMPPSQITGYDKAQLREMVKIKTDDSGEELARTLYELQEKEAETKATMGAGGGTRSQMQNQAAALGNMTPDQLRQQAQMMRSVPPSQIRRMNPAMANFSDVQIQMAANQMETMANNPQMMEGMVNQMKNMSPAELEQVKRMQSQGGDGAIDAGSVAAGGNNTQSGMQSMADMTPDQLRQQASMMKSMTPDALRSMNPAMANWSDAQIQMAITQMETMANNPGMMEKMKDQMKGMKPEDVEKIRDMAAKGDMGSMGMPGTNAGTDGPPQNPMDILNSTDPSQIKQMLEMVKENPQVIKDLFRNGGSGMPSGMANMSDEQIDKTINAFANMDERKIGWILKVVGWAQKFKNSSKMKVALFLVVSMFVSIGGMLIYLVKKSKDLDDSADLTAANIPEVPIMEESEF